MSAENRSFRSWAERLVGEIVDEGSLSALAPEHMDRLLAWLAGKEGPSSDLIAAEVSARSLDKTEAKRLALSALDEYLFGDDPSDPLSVLGLDSGSDQDTIKTRYRRLMLVYHPDRAVVHGDWLTKRAETINQAYSRLNIKGQRKPSRNSVQHTTQISSNYGVKAGEGVYSVPQDRFHLRKSLGSAQKLQRGVLTTLVVLSLLMLGLMYISSREVSLPPKETLKVDLVAENPPHTGLDGPKWAGPDLPGRSGAAATPARGLSPAAVEQSRSVVRKKAEAKADEGAEEAVIESQDAVREVVQEPAGKESIHPPKRKKREDESDSAGKKTEQERILDSEQSATAARGKIKKKTDSVSMSTKSAKGGTKKATIGKRSTTLKRKKGDIERDSDKKETEQERAIDPEQGVVAAPRKTRERKPFEKDRPVSLPGMGKTEKRKKITFAPPTEYQRKPTTMERFVAKDALVSYVDGIEEGNIHKVSSSIGQEITVDGILKSRDRLVTEYQTLFRNTEKRKYDFNIKSWRVTGNGTIRIVGDADILYDFISLPTRSYKGKLAYYLVKKGMVAQLIGIVRE